MKTGRPFEPGNKFGRGRPRGSRNKRSLLALQLLDSHAESVVRKALVDAMKGDAQLLRALLGHILPRRRDAPVKTGPLPVHTAEELAQSSEAVFERAVSGQITLQEAQEFSALIEDRRRVMETRDLDARLRALEEAPAKPEL
jgi:hypothetical protein